MKHQEITKTTKVTVVGTEKNTYEIIRELENTPGEEVIIIQVYPTIGIHAADTMDSTSLHLQNKMSELHWNKVHMLNLFSNTVTKKPLASTLKSVDEENLTYIENTLKTVGQQSKVIICWGNSLMSNKAANESKKKILECFQRLHPKKKLWHIITDGMYEELVGTHILFLGLRYSNNIWTLAEYPLKKELERLKLVLQEKPAEKPAKKAAPKAKSTPKDATTPEKKEEENVPETHD